MVKKMAENNLKQYIDEFFNDLELYDDYTNGHNYKDLLHASVIRFLDFENTYTAYDIYENFFMIYQITDEDKSEEKNNPSTQVSQSNTLLKLVNMMKDYEDNTGDLIEKQWDHFIHSVNVFVLGLAIYSQNSKYQEEFEDYILRSPYKKYYRINGELSREEFLYRWGIASLFHDIGYPVEIIGKQLAKFVNDGSQSISSKYKVNTAINFKNFNELNSIVKIDPNFPEIYRNDFPETNFIDLYKPTDIMAHQIFTDLFVDNDINAFDHFDKLSGDLKKLIDNIGNFVDYMAENGFIDHGYFSSIFVMNSYALILEFDCGNRRVTLPVGQQLQGDCHGRILFPPRGCARIILHGNNLFGIDDFKSVPAVSQAGLYFIPAADQHDLNSQFVRSADSTGNYFLRRIVAAHGINNNLHKTALLFCILQ